MVHADHAAAVEANNCWWAGASLQAVEAFTKQLFSSPQQPMDQDASEASQPCESIKLRAAFLSSMAGIAADAVLAKPPLEATSSSSPADDKSGLLISLLISAGGMFYAQQQASGLLLGDGSGSVQGSAPGKPGKEADGASPPLAAQKADVEAAIQHCLQVCLS